MKDMDMEEQEVLPENFANVLYDPIEEAVSLN